MLVLDEPTAHLDPATAEELMQDVFDAAGDQSILLITHRREGLDLVDRVIGSRAAGRLPSARHVRGQRGEQLDRVDNAIDDSFIIRTSRP